MMFTVFFFLPSFTCFENSKFKIHFAGNSEQIVSAYLQTIAFEAAKAKAKQKPLGKVR